MNRRTWMLQSAIGLALPATMAGAEDPIAVNELCHSLLASYRSCIPHPPLPKSLTTPQAQKIAAEFVLGLSKEFGPPIGYKAALTNATAQQRFGVKTPIRGVLLEEMMLKDGAVLAPHHAAVAMLEGDLVVRVRDEMIEKAESREQLLAGVDAVYPFIELPDLVYSPDSKPTAAALIAVNGGARLGVLGTPIPLTTDPEWVSRLGKLQAEVIGPGETVLAKGSGKDLLGHPLEVVRWIRDSLKQEGRRLRRGDLLSLGSLTPLMPCPRKQKIVVRYIGLDPSKPVEVSAEFQ